MSQSPLATFIDRSEQLIRRSADDVRNDVRTLAYAEQYPKVEAELQALRGLMREALRSLSGRLPFEALAEVRTRAEVLVQLCQAALYYVPSHHKFSLLEPWEWQNLREHDEMQVAGWESSGRQLLDALRDTEVMWCDGVGRGRPRADNDIIVMHGERLYSFGGSPARSVTDVEDTVLQAFVGRPVLSDAELSGDKGSGVQHAGKVLRRIVEKYPGAKRAIKLPGKSKCGYCAKVVRRQPVP
jgi:hypothetical protein